jgi:hypothetical protein
MATGIVPVIGRPGIGTAVTAQRRYVFRDGHFDVFPRGGYIEGSLSRDPGNSAYSVYSLRPGTLMGKITSGGYWAPSIIGVTTAAYTSGGTELTVSAAQAAYLVARVGASGTFNLIGPASAAASNNTTQVTYSAVNTTTGVITVTNIGANRIAGCFVAPEDGSQVPRTLIPDGHNLLIDSVALGDVDFARIPIAGIVEVDNVINWPSDTTLKTFVRESMSTLAGGKFVFSDQFEA